MESAQFYHFARCYGSADTQYAAFRGVANLADQFETQGDYAVQVLTEALRQAVKLLLGDSEIASRRQKNFDIGPFRILDGDTLKPIDPDTDWEQINVREIVVTMRTDGTRMVLGLDEVEFFADGLEVELPPKLLEQIRARFS